METLIVYALVAVVGMVFTAMAVFPMIAESDRKPARQRHLVLVHSAKDHAHPVEGPRAA